MSKRLLALMLVLILGATVMAGCFPFTKKYTLNVTVVGEGTVSPASGKFKKGESVTLTATPKADWRFENWGGGAFGHHSTITVVMDQDLEVIAHFVPSNYDVTTSVEGQGTIEQTLLSGSRGLVSTGSALQLKAVPAAGWHFKEWQGDLTGSLNPETIIVDKNYQIKAVFKENTTPVTWNFLVYLDGDNDLEDYAIIDINEMEKIGSTADVNIMVLVDRTPHYDSSNGDWTGTRLYRITKDANNSTEIISELVHDYGELDMSDPDTLKNFLLFCHDAYPAEQTILTLWDHGDGVYPKGSSRNEQIGIFNPQGICWDDTTGTEPWMCLTTDEVAAALADVRQVTGKKIEILNMDACLMQTLEVAYEWRTEVDYLVGSQADVPSGGNNYETLLQVLTSTPLTTARIFAETLVEDYYSHYSTNGQGKETYSMLGLGQLEFDNLIAAFKDLATALNLTTDLNGAFIAWKYATYFSHREYNDLYHFAEMLIANSTDPEVQNKATALQTAIGNAVIKHRETTNYQGKAFGLSICLPSTDEWENYSGPDQYTTLLLSVDSDWDEFVVRFVEYTAQNTPGQLLKAEITWPSGNCDIGISEPDENFYWVDQGTSPNGVFSADLTNGGTESWTLNSSFAPGVYIPQVFSYDFTGTVNCKLTLKCGTFNSTIDVTAGYGYALEDLQIITVNGVLTPTYKVRQVSIKK